MHACAMACRCPLPLACRRRQVVDYCSGVARPRLKRWLNYQREDGMAGMRALGMWLARPRPQLTKAEPQVRAARGTA